MATSQATRAERGRLRTWAVRATRVRAARRARSCLSLELRLPVKKQSGAEGSVGAVLPYGCRRHPHSPATPGP